MTEQQRAYELAFSILPASPDLDAYLAVLQRAGVRHVAIHSAEDWRDHGLVVRVGEAAARHGLQIVSCHSPIGLAFRDDIERSIADNQQFIEIAAAWGARSTVWHFRSLRGDNDGNTAALAMMNAIDHAELDALLARVLPDTCAYAAARGVQINLENLPLLHWSRDSFEILRYIRQLDLPALGFVLDSGHAHVNGEDLPAVIREAGVLLRDTHFHDNPGPCGFDPAQAPTIDDIRACDLHLVPGMGTIDWIGVIRALWSIEFQGPIVFEAPHIPGASGSSVERMERDVDLTIRMWRALEAAARHDVGQVFL